MTEAIEMHPEEAATRERIAKRQERVARSSGWGETEGGLAISRRFLPELSKGLSERLETVKVQDGQKRAAVIAILKSLDPDVVALITLSRSLHSVAIQNITLTNTCTTIGHTVENECWGAALLDHEKGRTARQVEEWARRRGSSVSARINAARKIAQRAGFSLKRWSSEDKVMVGGWLIEALLEILPDVFRLIDGDGERSSKYLAITEGAEELATRAVEQAVRANPVTLPQATPPAPWTDFRKGPRGGNAPLMRTHHRESEAAVRAAIRDGSMQPTLDALNAIQATAWKINTRVLDVILECERQGLTVKGGAKGWGVPPREDIPEPPLPRPWDLMEDLERNLWRMDRAAVRKGNLSLISERLQFAEDTETAQQLAGFPEFYTPYNMDWRGRVYGLPHFNFQREDRVRACFQFAQGEPIGERGIYWLKVHTANCGDFGKVSKRPYEERVQWVDQNAAVIQAIAANPLAELLWLEADKPFLFLAACVELSACLQVGPSFDTHLPVSWDGSCSGLQHLCAMTRAPEGRLVNLTPSEEPQDVYQLVADVAFKAMEGDLDDEKLGRFAAMALAFDGNRRKAVKRNVMTYSYSSKMFGMRQQHIDDLMEPLAVEVQRGKRPEHPFGDNRSTQGAAAAYLAKCIYAAIESVVDRPARAMGFLQKLARALAHEGKPLEWVSPTGLPWSNRYHPCTTKRVRLWMHDQSVSLVVATGYEKGIDKDRAANGVAPNLVHACDACHLMMVILAAMSEGFSSFALVHDSFGCHASRADRFHQIIREQFVKLYTEHDVLSEVLERAKCALSEHNWDRLPECVEPGELNIEEVLNASYAFA